MKGIESPSTVADVSLPKANARRAFRTYSCLDDVVSR